MTQLKLAAITLITISCGWPVTQAMANSVNALTIDKQERQAASPHTVNATYAAEPLASQTDALQERAGTTCDGETPSATAGTVLLGRIVRSPSTVRGVQCPIPSVFENLPIQESHP